MRQSAVENHVHSFTPPPNDDEQQCDQECRYKSHICSLCGKSREDIAMNKIKQKTNEFWYRWARNNSLSLTFNPTWGVQFAADFEQWLRNGEKFPEHWR